MVIYGEILDKAKVIINGARQKDYGNPTASFSRIAAMWSAYLDRKVSARDVACMMALFKLAREAHAHKDDNLVDAAGYIGLAGDMTAMEDGE